MTKTLAARLLATAIGLAALTPAFAQMSHDTADKPAMGMMGDGCPMMGMMSRKGMNHDGMAGMEHASMTSMAEGRLAFLKSELAITEPQLPVWTAYADAVRAQVSGMETQHQAMMKTMDGGTAPARMDAHIAGMTAMLAAMTALKAPLGTLYDALATEQKAKADELIGGNCGAM